MKRVLASVIDLSRADVTQEHLVQNFTLLRNSRFDFGADPEDEAIVKFLRNYFETHFEMPSMATVKDFFGPDGNDDTETFERLKDIESVPEVRIRTNFKHLLGSLVEQQARNKAMILIRSTGEIISTGLMVEVEGERDKVKKFGVRDGLLYFQERASDLITPDRTGRHEGNIRLDGQEVWDDYITAKLNKHKVWGKLTGIDEIDIICHGLKRGEMHVHAAYAGELKSTFALNWAYNLVTTYRTNVFYASFEMKYDHLRRMLYVMHSANGRWPLLGYDKPLDYRKVRDGELTDDEEKFYKLVIEDFHTNPKYCEFHVWEPEDDVTIENARMKAELLHKQCEIGFVVLDHGGLMEARKKKKNNNYTVELNSVIRDSKKFALHFNHGEGMPVLMLFQINRTGKSEAEKSDPPGIYKMNALSYANEAEKSADVVTTTYLDDDLRRDCQSRMCNLKNRDNQLFDPFLVKVDFGCRRMRSLSMTTPGMNVTDHPSEDIAHAMDV